MISQRLILVGLSVTGASLLAGPILWRTVFCRPARLRRRWRGYLKRLPNIPEPATWIREGYVGFEDGSKAGGWGGCEGRYQPFPGPLSLGERALHVHPWPAAHVPTEGGLQRLKPLSVPWEALQPGGDGFTWRLCEDPPLVLHLASEGAKALERKRQGGEHP